MKIMRVKQQDGTLVDIPIGKAADGKSAYEIALELGLTTASNERDWINSLQGTKVVSITESTEDDGENVVKFSDGQTVRIKNGSAGSKAIYVGEGDMPKEAILQLTLDEVDEEKALKDELESYIDIELARTGQVKPEFANDTSECTDTTRIYVLPDGYIYKYQDSQWVNTNHKFITNPAVQTIGDSRTEVMSQRAVTDYVKRIIQIDGMITLLFESGGMAVTEGTLTYGTNSKKIRTKEGVLYKVKAGSKVWLTDYSGLALTVYYSYDGSYFYARSVPEGEFVFDADCQVAISINSDVAQTDLSNAEKIVFVNADNVLQRVSTLEDQNGFIIDEGFGYKTSSGVAVGTIESELNSIKTKVQSGEKYSITALATNHYRPYATTDKNLNIIRLCETTSFSGELIIEDGEEYLVTNFKPLYENKFYLNTPKTLSLIKEILSENAENFDTLLSKDIFPKTTRNVTAYGINYRVSEDGTLLATGTVEDASYYNINNADAGFPDHFYPGKTYYVDYYSYHQWIRIQVRWKSADGTFTYLINNNFGGYFTIPEEAVGLQIRWYLGSSVHNLEDYPLKAKIYSAESSEFARFREERANYRPMLTIIYDDSHPEFHEYILPIIKSKNVPIGTAVTSQSVNENRSDKMTWEQIQDCFLNGAEVLDHTYGHIDPATRETMSVEELEREYLMGRHLLQLKGFNPPCALIFNGYTARLENCRRAASRVYKAGFNASSGGINFHSQFDPYNINRYGTDGQSLDALKSLIDNLVTAGTGWMVWTRHNSNASTEDPTEAANILASAIDYAIEQGIDIVTVERGLYEYLEI